METIGYITIGTGVFGTGDIVIDQDEDRIVVRQGDIEEFAAAIRKRAPTIEEPVPTPEKWYVVLKNSNSYLTTHNQAPMTFTDYEDARRYGAECSHRGRTYCPVSVDEYESAFGR